MTYTLKLRLSDCQKVLAYIYRNKTCNKYVILHYICLAKSSNRKDDFPGLFRLAVFPRFSSIKFFFPDFPGRLLILQSFPGLFRILQGLAPLLLFCCWCCCCVLVCFVLFSLFVYLFVCFCFLSFVKKKIKMPTNLYTIR